MTKAQAMYNFYSSFGLPAYEENSVPTTDEGGAPEFPYITYELDTDGFGSEVALTASIWYRTSSWSEANAKAEKISEYIGRGGVTLSCDGGAIWIKRGKPFAQRMGDDSDNMIKRIYMNISVEFLTEN